MNKEEFIIYLRHTIYIIKRNYEVLNVLNKYEDISDYPNSDALDLLIKILATHSKLNADELSEYICNVLPWSVLPRDEELGKLFII